MHDWKLGSQIDGFFHLIDYPGQSFPGSVSISDGGSAGLLLYHDQTNEGEGIATSLETGTTVHGRSRDGGYLSLFCQGYAGESWRSNGVNETRWRVKHLVDGDHVDLRNEILVRSIRAQCDSLIPLLNHGFGYYTRARVDGKSVSNSIDVSFSRGSVRSITVTPRPNLEIQFEIVDEGQVNETLVEFQRKGYVQWTWAAEHPLDFKGADPDVKATASMLAALVNAPVFFSEFRVVDNEEDSSQWKLVHPGILKYNSVYLKDIKNHPLSAALNFVAWDDYSKRWWKAWAVASEPLTRWHRLTWHDELPLEWSFFLQMTCFESLLFACHGTQGSGLMTDKKGKLLRLGKAMDRFSEDPDYSKLLDAMSLRSNDYFPSHVGDSKKAFERICALRNTIGHGDSFDANSSGKLAAHLKRTGHLRRLVELMILESMCFERNQAIDFVRQFVSPADGRLH